MNSVAGFYHLLIGILNSAYDGARSYVDLYGFTEILPGQISTNRVVSSDGLNFIDFLNNAFRVGNSNSSIDWNVSEQGKLSIINAAIELGLAVGEAKTILRPDGTGMLNGGDIEWDSVKTKIANFIFSNQVLESQQLTNGIANIILNGLTGYASFGGGNAIFNPDGTVHITGKFSSESNGARVDINPSSNSKMVFLDDNRTRGQFRFGTEMDGTSILDLILSTYRNGVTTYTYYGSSRMTIFGLSASNLCCDINAKENTLIVTFRGLPLSPTGLNSGDVWRDSSNYLRIVP
jgi:hypothetical protein